MSGIGRAGEGRRGRRREAACELWVRESMERPCVDQCDASGLRAGSSPEARSGSPKGLRSRPTADSLGSEQDDRATGGGQPSRWSMRGRWEGGVLGRLATVGYAPLNSPTAYYITLMVALLLATKLVA
jgi:hypothetical protein